MSDLTSQIRDYFEFVDEQQGAVDLVALREHSAQPVQPLAPVAPLPTWPRAWALGTAAAAAIALGVLVPLLLIALGDEPDVATTIPPTTEASVPTTTIPEATTVPEEAAPTSVPEITTTTTPVGATSELVLGGDGIGIASFGDDEETVIASVTAILGEPSSETTYENSVLADYCGGIEFRSLTWGSVGDGEGGHFSVTFVREPVRTMSGPVTGFVGFSSSTETVAGDGGGIDRNPHTWLPGLAELSLLEDEQAAVALYGDRLSEATPDDDDGIPPIIVSRHLDLGGPWQTGLGFWDGELSSIYSGPCPSDLGLSLEGNGIGIARFGDDPETVIAAISRVLGDPSHDSGFITDQLQVGVVGFCGEGRQRLVSWDNFDLGFVDQEIGGHNGFVAYALPAVELIHGAWEALDQPPPPLTLPMGVGLFDTEESARTQYQEEMTQVANHPVVTPDRWARLDLGGPWPVNLWFDESGTDRITRITSTPCEP